MPAIYCDQCEHFTGEPRCARDVFSVHSNGESMLICDGGQFTPKTKTEEEPIKKAKKYYSQQGFELIPLRRGFTEIIPLWQVLQEVINSTKNDCFICGGYARYCASPKYNPAPASDIDIYSQSEYTYEKLRKALRRKGLVVKLENKMAVSYEHPTKGEFHYMPPLQVIKPINQGRIIAIGNKETILSNFDFSIIRAAIESPYTALVDADFCHDEIRSILRLKNIHHPLSSLLRCAKYISQGYWLTPVEAAKLFKDWEGLKDEYKSELLGYINEIEKGVVFDKEHISAFYDLFRGRKI